MYPVRYNTDVIEIRQTDVFAKWFDSLRDKQTRSRILVRIRRLSLGNAGDVRPVGEGVSELRIHSGPGYRVYFINHNGQVIILLAGGDKSSQSRDIRLAIELARNL